MSKAALLLNSIRAKLEGGQSIMSEVEMNKILWNCAVMIIAGTIPEILMENKHANET